MFLLVRYSKDEDVGCFPSPVLVFGILYCGNLREGIREAFRSTVRPRLGPPRRKQE